MIFPRLRAMSGWFASTDLRDQFCKPFVYKRPRNAAIVLLPVHGPLYESSTIILHARWPAYTSFSLFFRFYIVCEIYNLFVSLSLSLHPMPYHLYKSAISHPRRHKTVFALNLYNLRCTLYTRSGWGIYIKKTELGGSVASSCWRIMLGLWSPLFRWDRELPPFLFP